MDSPLSWVKDLWGSGRDNVFAVGGDEIWRFNGREWSQMIEVGSPYFLRSVWGSAYDASYIALAEAQNCDLITGDKKLCNAVSKQLKWVKLLCSEGEDVGKQGCLNDEVFDRLKSE